MSAAAGRGYVEAAEIGCVSPGECVAVPALEPSAVLVAG
jgi:hypothetical protein